MEEYDITDSTVRLVYQSLRGLVNATDAHKHNSVMCGFDPQQNQEVPGFRHWLQIGSWLYPVKTSVGPSVFTKTDGHCISFLR